MLLGTNYSELVWDPNCSRERVNKIISETNRKPPSSKAARQILAHPPSDPSAATTKTPDPAYPGDTYTLTPRASTPASSSPPSVVFRARRQASFRSQRDRTVTTVPGPSPSVAKTVTRWSPPMSAGALGRCRNRFAAVEAPFAWGCRREATQAPCQREYGKGSGVEYATAADEREAYFTQKTMLQYPPPTSSTNTSYLVPGISEGFSAARPQYKYLPSHGGTASNSYRFSAASEVRGERTLARRGYTPYATNK